MAGAARHWRWDGHRDVVAMLAVGVTASVALGWAVRRAEDVGIEQATREEAVEVTDDLGRGLNTRVRALRRMAHRWRVGEGTDEIPWRADAAQYLADYDGLWSISVLDPEGHVRWREPPDESAEGVIASLVPGHLGAMESARASGKPVIVAPVELRQGDAGIVAFVPLESEGFDGWLMGTFQIAAFTSAAQPLLLGYDLTLFGPQGPVYSSTTSPSSTFCHRQPMVGVQGTMEVQVCATRGFVAARRGGLPSLTVLVGLVFSALSAALLRLLDQARTLARRLGRQAEDLERAQRDLADLSYSISHELRTPLRAIDGHAAMLLEHAPAESRQGLGRIRVNAQRMGRQLDGLIELFRVIRRKIEPRDVDVTALARAAIARHAAADPGRTVDATVAEGLVVHGDPQLVAFVVAELIENAWTFSAGRERVTIEVGPTPHGFFVRDEGAGFDMAFAGKLFRAFERLHSPGEFEGLGLGLAIAERAVARHGGRIRAEGEPGKGAVFRVEWGRTE